MSRAITTHSRWDSLLQQWGKDLQLWLYISTTLQLFRIVLISTFHQQAGATSGASTVLTVLGTGLRYDVSTAGAWIVPTFLLSLICAPFKWTAVVSKIRTLSATLYAISAIIIFGVDLIFFGVYGDQLNQMIFGIVYDDTKAILITIWKQYHPLLFLLIVTPAILGNIWLLKKWLSYDLPIFSKLTQRVTQRHQQVGFGFITLLFVTLTVRGGTLWGEPVRLKHAFVVDDIFLNRTVVNPFSALRYTINAKLELDRGSALASFWPSENIREALGVVRQMRGAPAWESNDLDAAMTVSAPGHDNPKPRHIFLLLMESHSGWTVMPQYRHSGLSPELSRLADEGIYFPNFLPAGSGTVGSMNTLITGMPDAGLNVNYAPSAGKPYPSSLAVVMKKLGYKTRFFYGGFLSWQRLDSFARSQGFDEVYGGGNMSAGLDTNEWGVNDKFLFDFVLKNVDDDTPSFNFILTTSNHPPYDLDLDALGYPVKALPQPLAITKDDTLQVMGHLWYADQQAGRFVRAADKMLHQPLFAITGDHTAREQVKFPGDNVAEQVAVPFVLYGPQVLSRTGVIENTAGAHLDVPATIIELAADKGYSYPAYGQSLLHKAAPSYGFGWQFIIGENFIANESEDYDVYGLTMQPHPASKPELSSEMKLFRALKALSWYRVMKGHELPAPNGATIALH